MYLTLKFLRGLEVRLCTVLTPNVDLNEAAIDVKIVIDV